MNRNVGGWKNEGGIGANSVPVSAAPSAIGWEPMVAAVDATTLFDAVFEDSSWE